MSTEARSDSLLEIAEILPILRHVWPKQGKALLPNSSGSTWFHIISPLENGNKPGGKFPSSDPWPPGLGQLDACAEQGTHSSPLELRWPGRGYFASEIAPRRPV